MLDTPKVTHKSEQDMYTRYLARRSLIKNLVNTAQKTAKRGVPYIWTNVS